MRGKVCMKMFDKGQCHGVEVVFISMMMIILITLACRHSLWRAAIYCLSHLFVLLINFVATLACSTVLPKFPALFCF